MFIQSCCCCCSNQLTWADLAPCAHTDVLFVHVCVCICKRSGGFSAGRCFSRMWCRQGGRGASRVGSKKTGADGDRQEQSGRETAGEREGGSNNWPPQHSPIQRVLLSLKETTQKGRRRRRKDMKKNIYITSVYTFVWMLLHPTYSLIDDTYWFPPWLFFFFFFEETKKLVSLWRDTLLETVSLEGSIKSGAIHRGVRLSTHNGRIDGASLYKHPKVLLHWFYPRNRIIP